jgi:hypothetical protein
MTKYEILTLLKSFSKKEMYRLHNFLSSPYFNSNKGALILFDEMRKRYPKFSSRKLESEYLYKLIFKDLPYKDVTMRNLYFRLGEMIEKFLKVENTLHNDLYLNTRLLNEYNKRRQNKLFIKFLNDLEKKMRNKEEMGNDYFHAKFLVEAEKYNAQRIYNFKTKRANIRHKINCIDNSAVYLTINYIREMLSFYLNQSIILGKYNLSGNNTLVSGIIKYQNIKEINKLFRDRIEHYFVLELYFGLWQCFYKFNDVKYYYEYKSLINKFARKLGTDEISFHYSKLITYCIYKQRIHSHSETFIKELLGVYDEFLKKDYYKNKKIDYIPHELYRNILLLAIENGELKYAKEFIEKYSRKVEPQLRDKMYNFGSAYYLYYSGQFSKSLECLSDIVSENFYFRYDARHLQIANNIGLGNYSVIEKLVHEYMVSVDISDMMSDELKEKHYNYLNTVRKLVNFIYGNNKIDPGFIKARILKNDKIAKKQWLMEFCVKLMSNKISRVVEHKHRISKAV